MNAYYPSALVTLGKGKFYQSFVLLHHHPHDDDDDDGEEMLGSLRHTLDINHPNTTGIFSSEREREVYVEKH